jgi:hypothetical protein
MTFDVLCVLGMHRSGTSCLTGLLEDAGVFLGEVSKSNPHNRKGNQENPRIMALNEAVLADAGAAWNRPPEHPVRWTVQRTADLRQIVADYRGREPWAFKDPRTLFTLTGWLEVLPELQFLGTFRHPSAVARSLWRRSRMPLEAGIALWHSYNRALLHCAQTHHIPLVDFDLPPGPYLNRVSQVFGTLGLEARPVEMAFFTPGLRRAEVDPSLDLPPETVRLYQALKGLTSC